MTVTVRVHLNLKFNIKNLKSNGRRSNVGNDLQFRDF